MKKRIFLFAIYFIAQISLINAQVYQLPNGDFEDWDGAAPTHWNSFESCEGTFKSTATSTAQVEKSTDIRSGASGTYSCCIKARAIVGSIIANGNLTTGRIIAGSMTPSNSANHNETQTNNADFNQPFNGKPDAIKIWAKSDCTGNGRVSAIIHQGGTMQDPVSSTANIVGWAVASTITGNSWKEYTIPFDYNTYSATNPDYILITFSTNQTAGTGSSSDKLWLDDVSFVYTANISNININGSLITGFNPSKTDYDISIPCSQSANINITATAVSMNANVVIVQPSASNNFTGTVTVTHGPESKVITIHVTQVGDIISVEDAICQGKSYTENGFDLPEYTEVGVFSETILIAAGINCFDRVNLTLTVNPTYESIINAQTCTGAAYPFYGEFYTVAGTYSKVFKTVNGCDSIKILHLTVGDRFETHLNATICEGECYNENNFNECETGNYEKTYPTDVGCDSVVFLDLTVGRKHNIELAATICEGVSYKENGFDENSSGKFTKTFLSTCGCDSVVTLNLTVNRNENIKIYDTIIRRNPYELNGFQVYLTDTICDCKYEILDSTNCEYKTLYLHIKEHDRPPIQTNPDFQFSIYPNPATTYFTIKIDDYEAGDIAYYLYNMNGLIVKSGMVTSDNFIVNTQAILSGMYILKLQLNKEIWKKERVFIKYSVEWGN